MEQTDFFKAFIDQKRNILIPNIQRDYVQGSNKNLGRGVIQSFLAAIASAIIGNKSLDLTYIYGYDSTKEGGEYFVPIDGQQRLTTLWLVYLYMYARINEDIPVSLEYETREYAQDFLAEIQTRLKKVIFNRDVKSLKKEICSSPWFIASWNKDQTVESCLNTLDELHKQFKNITIGIEELRKSKITFSFYPMQQMQADIYLKMNGRGKPLSEFENLKSWLDDYLETNQISFVKEWKNHMDNKWASMFWANRNKTQLHQEEIDDEQLRFFYNLLYIYWAKQIGAKGKKHFTEIKEEREVIAENLGVEESKNLEDFILEKMKGSRNYALSLYLLEKLNLVNDDFINYYYNCLNVLCQIHERINSENGAVWQGMWRKIDENHTLTYSIFFASEPTENKDEPTYATLALINVLLQYLIKHNNEGYQHLDDWFRVFRNLIENTTISKENIYNVLVECDRFVDKCQTEDLLSIFCSEDISLPFFSQQIMEERAKAKMMNNPLWREKIITTEHIAFFKGSIRFLFTNADGEMNDWDNFDTKLKRLQPICNNETKDNEKWELLSDYVRYADKNEILASFHEYGVADSDWRKYLLSTTIQRVTHLFLLNDKQSRVDSMAEDIRKIIVSIQKPIWILQNWQGCQYVLTNYSRRNDSFSNGYVYVINTKRNDYISALYEANDVSDIKIPECWRTNMEYIECEGKKYYRGLYTDFTYKGQEYRLKESTIVRLDQNHDIVGNNITIVDGDIIATLQAIQREEHIE